MLTINNIEILLHTKMTVPVFSMDISPYRNRYLLRKHDGFIGKNNGMTRYASRSAAPITRCMPRNYALDFTSEF